MSRNNKSLRNFHDSFMMKTGKSASRTTRRSPSRPRKVRSLLGQERLEPRYVMATGLVPVEDLLASFSHHEITGATIITHGFQPSNNQLLSSFGDGDSLRSLATAITSRIDAANGLAESAWLLDYDVPGEGLTGRFDLSQSILPPSGSITQKGELVLLAQKGELILLFDWAPESNELSAGWGEAAGDALFSLLVGLRIVNPTLGPANPVPLHFIGHSFGTAVTSEVVERLAHFDVPVDQVTYLDPHDFDQALVPVDGQQRLFTLGEPQLVASQHSDVGQNYGATVWKNVAFSDVYYQTESAPIPEGRPIPGAYNLLVNEDPGVDGAGAHSHVWNPFYLSTVTDASKKTGYAFSRVARAAAGDAAVARPAENFYGVGQDHEHTSSLLVLRDNLGNVLKNPDGTIRPNELALKSLPSTVVQQLDRPPASSLDLLSSSDIVFGRWKPLWQATRVVNGSFDFAGDENDTFLIGDQNLIPGWSHHGGRGLARVVPAASGFELELRPNAPSRTKNRFYLPSHIGQIEFDARVTDFSQNEANANLNPSSPAQLVVTLATADGQAQQTISRTFSLDQASVGSSGSFVGRLENLPLALRNRVVTLTFALVPQDGPIDATVRIAVVRLVEEALFRVRTGDVLRLDLKTLHPEAQSFEPIRFRVAEAGNLAQFVDLHHHVNAKRLDWTLHRQSGLADTNVPFAGTIGTILFSHRLDSTATNLAETQYPFGEKGFLFFAPGTDENLYGDAAGSSRGFQGYLQFLYRIDGGAVRSTLIEVRPGYSEAEDLLNSAGLIQQARDTLNNMQAQQRLNYLGFPDYEGLPLAVDGIIGPRTASAISLFKAVIDPSGTGLPQLPSPTASYEQATEQAQGQIDELTLAWLNSRSAPRWQQLAQPVTNLANAIDQQVDSTSLIVTSPVGLPPAPFTIRVGQELMTAVSVVGTTLQVQRGAQDTTRAEHASGAQVLLVPEHGYGTSWLFDVLAEAGLIVRNANGIVTDLSRIRTISPRRPDGTGFASPHADSNPADLDSEHHLNGLQVDIDVTGLSADPGKTLAETLRARLTASGRIPDAFVRHPLPGSPTNLYHVTIQPPRLLAFTEPQEAWLKRGLQALRGRLGELESVGDLGQPLPLIGPTGFTAAASEQVRLGEALKVRQTVQTAFDLILAHLDEADLPTVDSLTDVFASLAEDGTVLDAAGKLREVLVSLGVNVIHAELDALVGDGLTREFELSLKTQTRQTQALDLGSEALALGLVLHPGSDQLLGSSRLGAAVPGWSLANQHKGPDLEITLRNEVSVLVSFDGLDATAKLDEVIARINQAISEQEGLITKNQF